MQLQTLLITLFFWENISESVLSHFPFPYLFDVIHHVALLVQN